jgi:alpha-tubulin suppressor-like RCC1 family protein
MRNKCFLATITMAFSVLFSPACWAVDPVVTAGMWHNVVVKTDGTLWAWGDNSDGQFGDGTYTARLVPTRLGTGTNWRTVAAGDHHTVALKTDGTLWAWGSNGYGQLGDGTTTNRNTPVQIGSATNWSAVFAGNQRTFALKTDGTLWGWGANWYGKLGDGTGIDRKTPTQIGNASNWRTIAVGDDYTMATKTDGTVWAWGFNGYDGHLGDGTQTDRSAPVQIGTATNWSVVSAGSNHTLATKTDGTLWAWGSGVYGQLGDGSGQFDQYRTPTKIGTLTSWSATTSGSYHPSFAVKSDGTLWAWGNNEYSQLGDGTNVGRSLPTQVGSGTAWSSVVIGHWHTLGLTADGTVWAWGYGNNGQLGDGAGKSSAVPVRVTSLVVAAPTAASADCVFSWAERSLAPYFSPPVATSSKAAPFTYRYYAGTGNYLVFSSTDSHIWVLGPSVGNSLVDVGPIANLFASSGCS